MDKVWAAPNLDLASHQGGTLAHSLNSVIEFNSLTNSRAILIRATLGGLAVGPAIASYLATGDFLRTNVFNRS